VLGMFVAVVMVPASQFRSIAAEASGDIVKVRWLRMQTPKSTPQFPPCHGDRAFTQGAAELECRLTADGHVRGCFVVSEQPADCTYGKAALSLVKNFQAMSRTVDGRRIRAGMRVRIPVTFHESD